VTTVAGDPSLGAPVLTAAVPTAAVHRYVGWFHELDAWTEYWDVYHPETRGRFYFGDGSLEPGLLSRFLPRDGRPPPFTSWTLLALYPSGAGIDRKGAFAAEVRKAAVAEAIMAVDDLVAEIFERHFGDAADPAVREDYLEAIYRFATNTLPAAAERDARIAEDDPRKRTAGRHTLDGDIQWFAWAVQIEGAHAIVGADARHPMRTLMLAGVASGCAANFTWRGHRRTRAEYSPGPETAALIRDRAGAWATDFGAASAEVHALYRIREWGEDGEAVRPSVVPPEAHIEVKPPSTGRPGPDPANLQRDPRGR
jgi:hypothetical protein